MVTEGFFDRINHAVNPVSVKFTEECVVAVHACTCPERGLRCIARHLRKVYVARVYRRSAPADRVLVNLNMAHLPCRIKLLCSHFFGAWDAIFEVISFT